MGLRVTWFLDHWVAGSQNVTQFHVWYLGARRNDILCGDNTNVCSFPNFRKVGKFATFIKAQFPVANR